MNSACSLAGSSNYIQVSRFKRARHVRCAYGSCHYVHRRAVPGNPSGPVHSRRAVRALAASGPFFKTLQKELDVQSGSIPNSVRERVEEAVKKLGYRATVGEVAARAGVKVSEADSALKALAYDSLGHLEVSSSGDVVYSFGTDFKEVIQRKSLRLRFLPWWRKIKDVGAYLLRVAFGTTLITSVVVVWLALLALSSASSRDDDRRGGYGYGGAMPARVFFNFTDFFFYWDPYYYRTRQERREAGETMSFVESIFSFVFGDGDPNQQYDEERWRALGQHIQKLGGVVTAEEMAPYLNPPDLPRGASRYEDEGFVLPALIKFGGEPFVDDGGHLLYRFPDLQKQLSREPPRTWTSFFRGRQAPQPATVVPMEQPWQLSLASSGQKLGTILLGILNVVGVLLLSSAIQEPRARFLLIQEGFGFVIGLLPVLQVYAASFFTIPLVRWLFNQKQNDDINRRNEARLGAVELLDQPPSALRQKQGKARAMGSKVVVDEADVVYRTDRDTGEQILNKEVEEWERSMKDRDQRRLSSGSERYGWFDAGQGRRRSERSDRLSQDRRRVPVDDW